jgi:hypothetical protein
VAQPARHRAIRRPGGVGRHPDRDMGPGASGPATASWPSAAGPRRTPVDMLRTRVVQLMRQNGWKRVAVTSPDKSAGKSTTCCNLLASLSRQTDRRTILFDLDLRRPALASILGHKGEVSFSAVLEGGSLREAGDPVQRGLGRVDELPARAQPDRASPVRPHGERAGADREDLPARHHDLRHAADAGDGRRARLPQERGLRDRRRRRRDDDDRPDRHLSRRRSRARRTCWASC